jgi:hypothetical protein
MSLSRQVRRKSLLVRLAKGEKGSLPQAGMTTATSFVLQDIDAHLMKKSGKTG